MIQTRIDRPYDITLLQAGEAVSSDRHLLLLATTLDKLDSRYQAVLGRQAGPIRVSTIPYPVPSIARWLLPLMYGGEDRTVPEGARGLSGSAFEIATGTPFVIDGEFFEPPVGAPLRLETGIEFTYVRG